MARLSIVGAGVSGLVAAIDAAERGWSVTVFESAGTPGGRGRSLAGPYRANTGPHALYQDGSLWAWLEPRDLLPPVVQAQRGTTLILAGDRLAPWPSELSGAIKDLPQEAPMGLAFRPWLLRHVEPQIAEAIIGVLFVVTYDHDPGRLSAAFMQERLRRTMLDASTPHSGPRGSVVRFVVGGWTTLVKDLVERALRLGVEVRMRSPVRRLGAGPTLIATSLAAARQITGDARLSWPSGATALLDLGLVADENIHWFRVLDPEERTYVGRFSAIDPGLGPPGHDLVQTATPCHPGETVAGALRRVERVLDIAWPGWRGRVRWQRRAIMRGLTGAVDLPGTTWRDRPGVNRGHGLYVATDQSAAPGVLSEVGAAAGLQAVLDLSDGYKLVNTDQGRPSTHRTLSAVRVT